MKNYIVALDQGTTSSRSILFDEKGNQVASSSCEFRQIFPQPGWVEHDPGEIWESQLRALRESLKQGGIDLRQIRALGITNQRETTVIWDRTTGEPIYNAIVWQSRQSESICQEIRERGWSELFTKRTGLVVDPYFSATKIKWILDHVEGAREKAAQGQLAFGTIDSGTGCFALMNTGTSPVQSRHGLLTTIAWSVDGQVEYALEGSVFIAGAAIQWLRDQLGLVETAGETESLARSIPSTEGVFLIPAFTGLGAPYWDSGVRGMLIGLTRGSERAHLVRAALESIAYQTVDVVRCFEQDSGYRVLRLQVDGGACANNFLMQFQADLLGIPLRRPKVIETTALGAAFLAGLGVGFWESREQIARHWQEDRVFLPKMEENDRQRRQERWQSAIHLARQWRVSS